METRDQFLERLFFSVFLDCIVLKDPKLYDFSILSKMKTDKNLPLQTNTLITLLQNPSFSKFVEDPKNFFTVYMNYQNLFKLEYFDNARENWYTLSESVVKTFQDDKLLCRIIPFLKEELNIMKSPNIDIPLVNQYFFITK